MDCNGCHNKLANYGKLAETFFVQLINDLQQLWFCRPSLSPTSRRGLKPGPQGAGVPLRRCSQWPANLEIGWLDEDWDGWFSYGFRMFWRTPVYFFAEAEAVSTTPCMSHQIFRLELPAPPLGWWGHPTWPCPLRTRRSQRPAPRTRLPVGSGDDQADTPRLAG